MSPLIGTTGSGSSRGLGTFRRFIASVIATLSGRLYMWGANYYGTGNGSGDYSYTGSTLGAFGAEVTWTSVTGGGSDMGGTNAHSLFVKNNGTMWAVGYNGNGLFGDGTATSRSSISQVGSATNWAKVVTGLVHSMAITTSGTLWATGYNAFGHLGLGDASQRYSWTQVGSSTWTDVACGDYHTLAIKSDGTLWGWGYNSNGQVGDGTFTNRSSPVQIGNRTDWVKIAAGYYGSMGITADGKMWAWGYTWNLPTGNYSYNSPVQIGSDTNWSAVSLGFGHGLAIKTTGTLWAWGYNNDYGQQGNGAFSYALTPVQIGSSTNWSKISTGYVSSFAINTSGNLYAWGLNNHTNYYYGQLQYGLDCFSQNYNKSLGFDNSYQYTYTESGYAWFCDQSYQCDGDVDGVPICYNYDTGMCDACNGCYSFYSPTYRYYSTSIQCYSGKHPSPVLVSSGTGNTFLDLAKASSGYHMAAIRTS